MEQSQTQTGIFPEKARVLSGSVLKLIALLTMFIDHTGSVLLSKSGSAQTALFSLGSMQLSLYELSRIVGRTAFPIYCFLITEGFHYTHDRKKYGINLFVFALLSEIPWNLEHSGTLLYAKQNVFFTLLLGYCCIYIYEEFKKDAKLLTLGLGLMMLIAVLLNADYGTTGIGFILLLHILREKKVLQAFLGCCLLNSAAWKIIPAFVLINLYNGKRGFIKGKVFKYLFYAAYPVHMLILFMIRKKTYGY